MTFLGNYLDPRLKEVSISRGLVQFCVRKLFRRTEFPHDTCMALQDSAMVNKNDVVFCTTDCEHPFDFVPMPSFDQLVLNLPSKDSFLKAVGVERWEEVSPEAEAAFWDAFEFEFGSEADGVKLQWE